MDSVKIGMERSVTLRWLVVPSIERWITLRYLRAALHLGDENKLILVDVAGPTVRI